MNIGSFQRRGLFGAAALAAAALMAARADAALIGFEAENGDSVTTTVTATVGADWVVASDAGALGGQDITPGTDFLEPADAPQSADKVASYDVDFAEAGTYDLYARVLVEVDANDDSFFYGAGFGSKDPTNGDDWITNNGPWSASEVIGDPESDPVVAEYFWVNISEFTGDFGEGGVTFEVAAPGAETIQIGAREDGFHFDALAFGTSGETFTDAQLTAAVVPEPAALGLLMAGGVALARVRRRC